MVRIRKIQPSDYVKAGNMIKKTIRHAWSDLRPKGLLDEFCRKYSPGRLKERAKEIEMFVAVENDKILGIIGMKNNELRTFFVDPKHQGRKIGRQLYDFLEKKMRDRGYDEIILEGSPTGEAIYKKFGFKKIKTLHKERKGFKFTDALMKKKLNQ